MRARDLFPWLLAFSLPAFAFSGDDTSKRFVGQKPPEIEASSWWNATKPVSLRASEGRVVLLEFFGSYNQSSVQTMSWLSILHKRYAAVGLLVLGITDEGKAVVEGFVREQGIAFPVGGGSKSGAHYGVSSPPYAYLIGADGVALWQGNPATEAEGVEKLIEKSLRHAQYFALDREVDGKLKPALAAAEKGEFGRAWKEAAKFAEDADGKLAADAKYFHEKLGAFAQKGLDLAHALAKEGNYFEASQILDRTAKRFAGHPAGATAEITLKEWAADPKISGSIEAQRLLDKADTLYNQRKLTQAKSAYEAFLKKFPQHEAAKDAQAKLDEVTGWIASCYCGSGRSFSRCHGKN